LRDDFDTHADFLPTRANILNTLLNLGRECINEDDEICIYYSGHGLGIPDQNGDELDGQDEIIVPCDVMETGFIVDDEINIILFEMKCKVILFFDCCNSGTICDLAWKYEFSGGSIKRIYQNAKPIQNKHIYMMSGSRDDQYSTEAPDYEYGQYRGAFSMALCDCLRFNKHHVSLLKLYMDICISMQHREQKPSFASSGAFPSYYLSTQPVTDGSGGNIHNWGEGPGYGGSVGRTEWGFYNPA
jgi:hypothetical protein